MDLESADSSSASIVDGERVRSSDKADGSFAAGKPVDVLTMSTAVPSLDTPKPAIELDESRPLPKAVEQIVQSCTDSAVAVQPEKESQSKLTSVIADEHTKDKSKDLPTNSKANVIDVPAKSVASVQPPQNDESNLSSQSNTDFVVPAQPEIDKSKVQPGQSKPNSVDKSDTNTVANCANKSNQPVKAAKLISERIAFEEPIVTDVEELHAKPRSIFTEVKGPSFYTIKNNLVTLPIIPKRLPEQFASLPVCGDPTKKDNLSQFYHDKIKDFVGDDITDEEFEKLATYCSPGHLKTGAEISMPVKVPSHGILANDSDEKLILEKSGMFRDTTDLCIHKKHQLRIDKDLGNHYCKRLKYRGIRLMPLSSDDGKTGNNEDDKIDLVPGKDMLFRVRIYRPYDYNIKYFRGRSRHAVFSCDVVLCGRQKLTALRDRFVCANDVGMRVDVSAKPDDLPPSSAKEVFPSGFLFINNTFYVDSRAGCADHAAALRAWARRRQLGDFPARDMAAAALQDVDLRLGYPEVYVHQGNCEHLFTFSEVRLVRPADPLRAALFPQAAAASTHQSVYCTTCAEYCAKWIVVGCARVPFDPAFFCDTCFKLYLYKDGRKIGDFKAYCYRGNELNMLKPLG